jgi:hypothetical protein
VALTTSSRLAKSLVAQLHKMCHSVGRLIGAQPSLLVLLPSEQQGSGACRWFVGSLATCSHGTPTKRSIPTKHLSRTRIAVVIIPLRTATTISRNTWTWSYLTTLLQTCTGPLCLDSRRGLLSKFLRKNHHARNQTLEAYQPNKPSIMPCERSR